MRSESLNIDSRTQYLRNAFNGEKKGIPRIVFFYSAAKKTKNRIEDSRMDSSIQSHPNPNIRTKIKSWDQCALIIDFIDFAFWYWHTVFDQKRFQSRDPVTPRGPRQAWPVTSCPWPRHQSVKPNAAVLVEMAFSFWQTGDADCFTAYWQ